MNNSEEAENVESKTPQSPSIPLENNRLSAENTELLISENTELSNTLGNSSSSDNQTSIEKNDVISQDTNVIIETSSDVIADNSMPPLPPLPKDDKGQPQPPAPYSADYNMQNYANYNYMYNYNNYYGYPYPQYQWDYNSQQYYQPYQNYYNYNYNANQVQPSKPPPPPPDAVQLPVEEKPANKTNSTMVDDSNRYSPTVETDDDDTTKSLVENEKSDVLIEQPTQTQSFTNATPLTVPSDKIEIQQTMVEIVDNKVQQPLVPSVISVQHPVVPLMQPYNIPVQQPTYLIKPQNQIQSTEAVNELINQQKNLPSLNGKDDIVEKVSKSSTVLGKSQAKKRLMAFSMMKQKLQEQNNSTNDNQSSDIGEGNDVEFVPDLNVFQTIIKKKVITNKKVAKVIKAQQTIEQIEEMKKDELLQGNNAALYQHLLRSNEAPILQKLGIESLAEKYSAKIREQDKRLKRHHHRHRDDSRRGHKHRHRTHSKSRSRSRSTEKPKIRALEVKSWKDFVSSGFHFDRFRRFKMDEAEERKEKERKSRTKKRHGDSRSDVKNHSSESIKLTEEEKGNGDQKLRYNILDQKKEILKGLEITTNDGDLTKDIPSYIIRNTKVKPILKFSENPARATWHLQNRRQMMATLLPEIESIVYKFFSTMKPKKLKENLIDVNYDDVDDKLLAMMKDKNIYPFKGWWPKMYFIVTQVKEDPNVEIDKDALINEVTTSKRTKKSRFNDNTSLTDLRPTVPSKWDSDYDGSPAATDKVVYVEVPQNLEMNSNNDLDIIINRETDNPVDVSLQEEAMDTVSDIGEDESKIEVNVCPILPSPPQEPQSHAQLDTEYEEFLKIVSVEKPNNNISNEMSFTTIQKENESNNLSVKSVLLNDDSVQGESEEDSSTDDTVSLNNVTEESMIGRSFVKSPSSITSKLRKKKRVSSKKSKKFKKKDGKRKKYKSSTSESSQDSESESDTSSDDSESETTNSSSTVEKKSKKKKSKNKKKKKSHNIHKRKYKGDKNKIKKTEDEKDSNSSILNLLEKALNVEIIKKRSSESEEPKQKKKKRKHDKKELKSNEENEEEFEKVKECLKETFTKLVKTDKVSKNQALSCDDSTVNEVLKYLKMDKEKEKKNKKSKKSSKRKHDTDNSDDEKTFKKSRLDCLKSEDSEKKKKSKKKKSENKFIDSDEQILKKKSKKKSKTTDTSETEDGEGTKYKKTKKEKESDHFFGLRPNDWNMINKSSMRGVVYYSDKKNKNWKSSTSNTSGFDVNVTNMTPKSFHSIEENSCLSNTKISDSEKPIPSSSTFDKLVGQKEEVEKLLEVSDKSTKSNYDYIPIHKIEDKVSNSLKNLKSMPDSKKDHTFGNSEMLNTSDISINNLFYHENDGSPTVSSTKNTIEQSDSNNDLFNILKPTCSKTLSQNDKHALTEISQPLIPADEAMSYRDKVKMNLKKLSTCQNIPFVFGFNLPLELIKSNNLKVEKNINNFKTTKESKPNVVETKLSNFDRPIKAVAVVCPQTHTNADSTQITQPKTDIDSDNKELHQSFSWEDSEESESNQSSVTSTSEEEHISDEEESDQLESDSSENNLLSKNKEIRRFKNEISNDTEVKDLASDSVIMSSSLDFTSKELELVAKDENTVAMKDLSTSSFLAESKSNQHFESNTKSGKILSPYNSNFVCSQNSNIDQKVSKVNNELITQWTSDWSQLDTLVNETEQKNYKSNEPNESQIKKKSRWDEQPKDGRINEPQGSINRQELKEELSNCPVVEIKNASSPPNVDEFSEDQNQMCEISLINSVNSYTSYDGFSENWSNEYDNYPQSQYFCIPEYSEMKTIDHNQLSPVDYTVYENYNPSYEFLNENDGMQKSLDIPHELITNETLSPIQVGNVLEILPTDVVSNDENELLKEELSNENIETTIQDIQDKTAKLEKPVACRNDQFVQLYQQHVQHYSQNPIKYSTSDPVLDNISEINLSAPEIEQLQEKLNTDEEDETIPIPLRDRAYARLIQDDNTNVFITSDNYLAYCAIEDKCLVHIAVNSSDRDGIEDKVRHCFNINQNGTVNEYWLHADLIPFHIASNNNSELGVLSDEEEASVGSDSGQDDVHNGDDDDYVIEGEWEMIDSDNDNFGNSWLNDTYIINKYGKNTIGSVEQNVSDINQEDNGSSSSEYDSDISDISTAYIENHSVKKENISVNPPVQEMSITKDNDNVLKNAVGVTMFVDVAQKIENSDISVKTDENLLMLPDKVVSNSEKEIVNEKLETTHEISTPEISSENNDTMSINLNKKDNKEKESGVLPKEEYVLTEDILKMNTIMNQKILIQRLKIRAKEKIHKRLPDTVLVHYSDNMETVKHPFLGLFQPPTISILLSEEQRSIKKRQSKLFKHVTFADGIRPGENLAASPTHDEGGRPLSPPPLKALMRETLRLKRNMYPFKKSKMRTKLTMVNKKVATVYPSVKTTSSSTTEYYISRHRIEDSSLLLENTANSSISMSDLPNSNIDHNRSGRITPPRPMREITPVPSDNECWNDDDIIKDDR